MEVIVHSSLLFLYVYQASLAKLNVRLLFLLTADPSQINSGTVSWSLFTLFYLHIKFATATRTWQVTTVCSTFWNNAELPVVITAHDLSLLPGRERLCRYRYQINAGEPAAIFCWANSTTGLLLLLALNFNLAFRVPWLTHAHAVFLRLS